MMIVTTVGLNIVILLLPEVVWLSGGTVGVVIAVEVMTWREEN